MNLPLYVILYSTNFKTTPRYVLKKKSEKRVMFYHPYLYDWYTTNPSDFSESPWGTVGICYDGMDFSSCTEVCSGFLWSLQSIDPDIFWEFNAVTSSSCSFSLLEKEIKYIQDHTNLDPDRFKWMERTAIKILMGL